MKIPDGVASVLVRCNDAIFDLDRTLLGGASGEVFSDAIGMVKFGFLAGFAFVWALLADFFLSPALLLVLRPLGPESALDGASMLPAGRGVVVEGTGRVESQRLTPEVRARGHN